MNKQLLELLPAILRLLAQAAGTIFTNSHKVPDVLKTVAALIDAGDEGIEHLQDLEEHLRTMIESGQALTVEDLDLLDRRSDIAHSIIQAWKPEEFPRPAPPIDDSSLDPPPMETAA